MSTIDLGGNTVIVQDIKVGATGPGQTGNSLSSTELTYLDGATTANSGTNKVLITGTSGAVTIAGAATFSTSPVLGAGTTIDLDSTTATGSSHAATITKYACVYTTESLTTAAGSSQAEAITLTGVAAGDLAFVSACGGTNTRQNYRLGAVTTSNTVTVTVYNNEPTNALNGTIKFNLWVLRA